MYLVVLIVNVSNGNQFFNLITFTNVRTSHQGAYTCHASFADLSISTMKTILLIVVGKSIFKKEYI